MDELEIFGTTYGGFYYPKNLYLLDENSVIYCFGAGEDITHDVILSHKLNSKVHIFDPTPRAIQHVELVKNVLSGEKEAIDNNKYGGGDPNYWNIIKNNPAKSDNIIMHNYGLFTKNQFVKFYMPSNKQHVSCSIDKVGRSNDYLTVEVKTLETIMKELGHNKIDLLKIDIENIECDVIEQMLEVGIYPRYLSVDFDLATRDKQRCINVINKLLGIGYKILKSVGQDITFFYTN